MSATALRQRPLPLRYLAEDFSVLLLRAVPKWYWDVAGRLHRVH